MTILGTLRFTTFKLIYCCEELTSELRMILVHAEVAHVSYLKVIWCCAHPHISKFTYYQLPEYSIISADKYFILVRLTYVEMTIP